MNTTSVSLLERLRLPEQQAAWDRFVQLYTPLLYHWALRFGLQETDAADLVQDILTLLVSELPRFHYQQGKRFRGWLWTVTVNKYREKERRRAAAPREVAVDAAALVGAEGGIDEIDEAEYRQYVIQRALHLMRSEFSETTWQACWEYAVRGRPAVEVAAELGVTPNAVHAAKSRVLRRLREELAGLLD